MYQEIHLLDVLIIGKSVVASRIVVHHYRYFSVGTHLLYKCLHIVAELLHECLFVGGFVDTFISH